MGMDTCTKTAVNLVFMMSIQTSSQSIWKYWIILCITQNFSASGQPIWNLLKVSDFQRQMSDLWRILHVFGGLDVTLLHVWHMVLLHLSWVWGLGLISGIVFTLFSCKGIQIIRLIPSPRHIYLMAPLSLCAHLLLCTVVLFSTSYLLAVTSCLLALFCWTNGLAYRSKNRRPKP